MRRFLLPLPAVLAACTPSPQDSAMPSNSLVPATDVSPTSPQSAIGSDLSPIMPERQPPAEPGASGEGAPKTAQAAQAPIPEAVAAEDNPLPVRQTDTPAAAQGRRTLSTAFVMVGPDGRLTVALRDGRVLVLRDVVMRPDDFCGVPVVAGSGKARYCGRYADIAAARAGGGELPGAPIL